MRIFTEEKRRAWNEVLFWARRLSYKQADKYPEWQQKYEEAKRRLNEIKEQERKLQHDLLQAR